MYRAAEQHISKGLSLGARLLLGFFSALCGIVMFLVAPSTEKAILFYAFGGFCVLVAVACITGGRLRQFLGSLIGSTLFLVSLFYLGHELVGGEVFSFRRSEPSVMNALFFLLAVGIPGAAYAASARFGLRKAP